VTEVRFYHLERRKLEDALPPLLEEAQAAGLRVVVQAPSSEMIETLDEKLWTYADDSFLPHGLARDGEPEAQPVLLTVNGENLNGAAWRVVVGGAGPLPPPGETAALARLILIFDGADAEARAEARLRWAEAKAAGHAPTYWREDDSGGWERAR
jgi:DNA polymerase-3 subunit chi